MTRQMLATVTLVHKDSSTHTDEQTQTCSSSSSRRDASSSWQRGTCSRKTWGQL